MTGLGSDHGGFELKNAIIKYLEEKNFACADFGSFKNESNDYPVFARSVCEAVLNGTCERGILICTTGIGISIAANRFRGIRAALCHDVRTAAAAREHNDANVLVLGSSIVSEALAKKIIDTFIGTGFSGIDRHIRRNKMLDEEIFLV